MVNINFDDGMIHFIFANTDDTYFLDSLICVDFKKYMYLSLKESGYQYVYFVDGIENDFTLHILDKSSFALFEKVKKQGFFGAFKSVLKKQSEIEYSVEHHFSDLSVPSQSLIELMKSNEKIAVVFSVEALNELRNCGETLKGFEKIEQKYKGKHHSLIVVSPTDAKESKKFLLSEESVFNSDLFSLYELYLRRGKVQIYKQLSDKYGERCIHFLNEVGAKELKNLVLFNLLNDISYCGKDLKYAQNMADYIYMLYHSEAFRTKEEFKLSNRITKEEGELSNPARRNTLISKYFFEDRARYEKMLARIKKYRQDYDRDDKLLFCWERDYQIDANYELIYDNEEWKNKVKRIVGLKELSETGLGGIKSDIKREICRITIINQADNSFEKEKIKFIEYCEREIDKFRTMPTEVADKMLRALKYVVCDFGARDFENTRGDTTEGQRGLEIIELHKTVIEISKLCYNIDERLHELKRNLQDDRQALEVHRIEEEEYEESHRSAVLNTEQVNFRDTEDIIDALELANLRESFINDYSRTMNTRCSQSSLDGLKNRLTHLMKSLEEELRLMETIELSQVSSVLSRAMNSIKSNRLSREMLTREITESTQAYDDMQMVIQEQNMDYSMGQVLKSDEEFKRIYN